MTIINVMVDDQRLEFSSMPVVASEGVKETYVKFALSSDWSGFGATALFYRDDSPEDVYTSVLDGAGLAEVPYEITAAPGWIRFGLSGSDGTSVHTSEILKYKVVKGKYTSGQSSEPPAPGIYEQMLAIAGQMRDTLNAAVIEQNAIIQGLVTDMDDLRSDMETEQTTFESVVTGQINTLVNNFAGSSRETVLFEGSHTVNIGDEIDLVSDPTVYDYLDIVLNDDMVGTIVGPTQNSHWRVTGETVKSTGTSVTTYVIEGVLDAQSLCLRVSTACAIVDTGTASTRYDLGSGSIADESLRRYCLKVIGRKLTDDAEVLNIRVGADGVTYQTAGTAVRSQLDKKLNAPISGGTVDTGTAGQLLATDGQGNTEWVDSTISDGSITLAKLAPGVIDTTYLIQGAAAESVKTGIELAKKADVNVVTGINEKINLLTFEDIASRNIYDNSDPTILNGFLSASAMPAGQVKFVSSGAAKCLVIPVEPLTQYTWSESSTYTRYSYGCYESIPSNDDIGVHRTAMESANVTQDGRHYLTFTTPADANYLLIYYYNSSDGIAEDTIRATIMLSEGDTLYPYEPYGSEKVFRIVKDDISETGTAGQTLMIGQDGSTLEWGTPSASVEIDNTLTEPDKAAGSKATGDAIEALKTDLETQLGQVVLTQGVQDWLDDHPEAMIVIKRNGDAEDTPTLGPELLSANGWTSDGWTGDFSNGFTNTNGNTNPLGIDISALESGALYQFQITTSNAATNGWSDFFVSLGGSDKFETYKGGGTSVSYTYGLICGSTKTLTITPRNSYTGTITGLSLKKVSNTVGSQLDLYDTDGNLVYQMRTAKASRKTIYQGKNSGQYNFWGYESVSLGDNALRDNTSGFWNTALGHRALESNQNGSRNIAIGYIALLHNTGGDRNVAVGTFALEKNTTGRNNVALNADSLQDNTTGGNNVGIGVRALCGNTTGSSNIGIGGNACANNGAASGNVGIGQNALTNCTGSNNIAIGNNAGDASGMSGSDNIVIGWQSDVDTPSGSHQIILGTERHTSVKIAGKTINFNSDGTVTWS